MQNSYMIVGCSQMLQPSFVQSENVVYKKYTKNRKVYKTSD